MTKRKPTFETGQLAFTFERPSEAPAEGGLAGFDRTVASAVGRMLKEDPHSRYAIAGGVSALLEDEVSKLMLDAYAAEARDGHNISFARFLALVVETQRFDILDALVQRIGCKILVGEEILTAELGQVDQQIERLQARRRMLRQVAPIIAQKLPTGVPHR